MEFRLVLRQTCGRHVHGVYDIYSSGQVRTLNVSSFRGSKYVYSFFWRLIQEDDSAININIQVAVNSHTLANISLEFVNGH